MNTNNFCLHYTYNGKLDISAALHTKGAVESNHFMGIFIEMR